MARKTPVAQLAPPYGTEVMRWTGTEWIPNDGKPGLAFSGKWPTGSTVEKGHFGNHLIPFAVFDGDVTPRTAMGSRLGETAMRYTASRYGCANGNDFASMKKITDAVGKYLTLQSLRETG